MPEWVPASQVPELAPYLGAPARPAMPAQPAMNMSTTTIFQYVLYGVLAFAAIVGLIMFINSFTFFSKYLHGEATFFGILVLLTSLFIMAVSVVIALRIIKKQKFGFLALFFFAIAFLFGLLELIILKWSMFVLLMIVGILGIACTIFAVIPMNQLGGPNGFKALLADKESSDLAFVIIFGVLMIALLIVGATKDGMSDFLDHFSEVKEIISQAKKAGF